MINLVTFFFEKNLRVEDVACGDNFTLFITKEGIFGVGNSSQFEMGSQWISDQDSKPQLIEIDFLAQSSETDVIQVKQVACGANFTVILTGNH